MTRLTATLCAVALLGCAPPEKKPYLTRYDRPLHISHRGGSEVFPQNTLLAYQYAVELYDTDVLEIDLHMTADGIVVVHHDSGVDETTDGTGEIKDMTYEALRSLDAGYRFTRDEGKTFPYRGRGLQVPTLIEVFQAFPDHLVNLEVKQLAPRMEEEVVRIVREMGKVDQVCMGSFDDDSAQIQRELIPEACHYAPEGMTRNFYYATRVGLGGAYPTPVDAFSLPPEAEGFKVIDDCSLGAIHDKNAVVWAWTINQPDQMRELLEMGVDGIMSDRPDLLAEVMAEMGIR